MGFMQTCITTIVDTLDNYIEVGSHKNSCNFRLFVLVMMIAVCAHPLICYFTVAQNPHVVFWIGLTPQYVIMAAIISMLTMGMFLEFLACCTPGAKVTKVSFFVIFLAVGFVHLGGGLYLAHVSKEATLDLTKRCGETALTMQIQNVWSKLVAFHTQCSRQTQDPDIYIQQCPGFEAKFHNDVYVQYIEDLEYDYTCQGFCHYHAKPLFTEPTDHHLVCAHMLAAETKQVVYTCAYPLAVLGASILAFGGCMASYEHL